MPDLTHVGMKIGRYEILDEIGQGAMGTVYRARDPLIERTVAIKTVSIAEFQQEGADAETRFLREAQSAGRLSHPNIVTIYDVGETDGLAYIAMEYLSGATLRDLMNKGPMPLELAIDTVAQMAEALAFAHDHGVIHRDIKPSNVVVTGQHGRIKLTDFGIAHLINSEHTQAGQMLGSPRYMSPEQAMGNEVDGRSDIFSLGAVLYEMLTGRYAFDGGSLPTILYRVINEAPVMVTDLRPGLTAGLADLLAQMLNKHPQARPDARTLARSLNALSARTPSLPAPAQPVPSNRVPRLLPILAFSTPIGVFLLIGVGLIVIQFFVAPLPHVATTQRLSNSPTTQEHETLPAPGQDESTVAKVTPKTPTPPAVEGNGSLASLDKKHEEDAYLAGLDKKHVELRIKRTELLLQYTDQHPDVVQIDRQLEQLSIERRKHLRQLQKNPSL